MGGEMRASFAFSFVLFAPTGPARGVWEPFCSPPACLLTAFS